MRMFLAGVETVLRGRPVRRAAFDRTGVTEYGAYEIRPDQFVVVAQGVDAAPSGTIDLGAAAFAFLSALPVARRNAIASRLGISRAQFESLTIGELLLLFADGTWAPDRTGRLRISLAGVTLLERDAIQGGAVEITEPFTYSNGELSSVSAGAWVDESANMNVSSNAVVYATNTSDQIAIHNTQLSSAAHYAQVVSTLSTTIAYAAGGVMVRSNGAVGGTADGYRVEYACGDEGIGARFQLYVSRIDDDVSTDVANTLNIGAPDTSAHTIRVEANGSTLETFIDAVTRNTYGSASSYTTNRFVGIYGSKYNGGNVTLDSFEAGANATGTTATPPVVTATVSVPAAVAVVPVKVTAQTTANSASSTATLAFDSGGFAAGEMAVVVVSCDNTGGGGAASLSSVTDAGGNTYTPRQVATYDPGAAAAGQTIGIFTAPIVTPLSATDDITINFSPNTTAKAVAVWRVTPGTGYAIQYVTGNVTAGSATGTPTVTTSSITAGQIVIAGLAAETNVAVTQDGDTSNGAWSTQQTATGSTGTVATSSRVATQWKHVTGTATQTYNPTLTSCDNILAWISLDAIATDATVTPGTVTVSAATIAPTAAAASSTATPAVVTALATTLAPFVQAGDFATDDFNRTAGDLGANWTALTGASEPVIVDDTHVEGPTNDTEYFAYWNADEFADDQTSQITVVLGSNFSAAGPTIRNSTTQKTCYFATWTTNSGGTYLIEKFVNGAHTVLDSATGVGTAGTREMRLGAVGDALALYVNDVEVVSTTDSDIASGQAGIFLYRNTGTTSDVDDFLAGPMQVVVDATATPGVVTASATAIAPTPAASSTATPAVVTATTTPIAPTLAASSTATPAVVTALAETIAPAVSVGSTIPASVVTATASVETPDVPISVDTVTATATSIAPTVTASSTATPAVVTATTETIAPTVAASSTATPAVVTATVETINPSSVSAGSSVNITADIVTATATSIAPTVSVGSTIPASVVDATATAIAPTNVSGSASATPAAVTATAETIAPTISTTATATPAVVTATAETIAPSASASSTATPAVVTATTTTIAPTLSASSTATPAVVTATVSVESPAVSAGGDVNIAASVVNATAESITPTPSVGSTIPANAVTATAETVAPSVSASDDANISAAVVTATATSIAPTASADATVPADTVTASAATLQPTAGGGAGTTPAVVTAAAESISPTISVGSTISAPVVTATTTTIAPGVSAGANVNVSADTVTTTISTDAPTFTSAVSVPADTITAAAAVLQPTLTVSADVLVTAAVVTILAQVLAATPTAGAALARLQAVLLVPGLMLVLAGPQLRARQVSADLELTVAR